MTLAAYLAETETTCQEMADLISVSRQQVHAMATGKRRITADLARRIAEVTRGAVPAVCGECGAALT